METRFCSECSEEFLLEDFKTGGRQSSSVCRWCRDLREPTRVPGEKRGPNWRGQSLESLKKTPVRREPPARRVHSVKEKAREYNELWASQGGKCAICSLPSPLVRNYYHPIFERRVRALLCRSCNTSVSRFEAGLPITHYVKEVQKYLK